MLRRTGSAIPSASSVRAVECCARIGPSRGGATRNSMSSTMPAPTLSTILRWICWRKTKSCRCQMASSTSTMRCERTNRTARECTAIFLPTAPAQAAHTTASGVTVPSGRFSFPRTLLARSMLVGMNHSSMERVLDWSAKFPPMRVRIFFHIRWLLIAMSLTAAEHGDRAYRDESQKWRKNYEANLRQDNGWLTLAGLFWLKEGNNRFGTGLGNDIVLPEGSAPEYAGTFIFHHGNTRLLAQHGVPVLLNGRPVLAEMPLKPDTTGQPDRIARGRLR